MIDICYIKLVLINKLTLKVMRDQFRESDDYLLIDMMNKHHSPYVIMMRRLLYTIFNSVTYINRFYLDRWLSRIVDLYICNVTKYIKTIHIFHIK